MKATECSFHRYSFCPDRLVQEISIFGCNFVVAVSSVVVVRSFVMDPKAKLWRRDKYVLKVATPIVVAHVDKRNRTSF